MTPFVETARQLVRGLVWENSPLPYVSHAGRRLEWRHHGLGMLQAEFSDTLRIHIWHPDLVDPKMAWPRCVHDHRFDLVSAVVVGAVIDVPCLVAFDGHRTPVVPPRLNVNVYEIEHAKNQDRMVGQDGRVTATSAKLLAHGSLLKMNEIVKSAAYETEYRIERRMFHTTKVEELAITVVHRSNFDTRLARVLCAPDADVTAVSGIVRDEGIEHRVLVNHVLRKAAGAIARLDSAS